MPFRGKRRPSPSSRPELVEIVTPRTNAAVITPAENLLAAISPAEPFGLEITATAQARRFVARAASTAMRQHLEDQLGVAYPQAELRRLDVERFPGLDPAWCRSDERVAACTLSLRGPAYLPLRTFRDGDVAADRAAQADPILGILGALGDLPAEWRSLSQLVLVPAPDDWCKDYLRLAVEHPLASERAAGREDTSLAPVFLLAGLLVAGCLTFQGYQWFAAARWLNLGLLATGTAVGIPAAIWIARRLLHRPIYDMRLVQEKVSRIAFLSEIRLAVFAPHDAPQAAVDERLDRLASAYRQFNLAAGNGLKPQKLRTDDVDLRELKPFASARSTPILNTRELAGLWHLPQAQADLPLLERTGARRSLPRPFSVTRGCHIGDSAHQGRSVPVALPDELLRRHMLLVAKTRRGKSSLLLRIAAYMMASTAIDGRAPALLLVDPHHDLAQATLGLVPHDRRGSVVYLDVAERERPFGLNLIDVGLGWDRDKAVSNALAIFRREFDRFWGPRMEDAFRFALLTLFEVNQSICAEDRAGRSRQHTILQVPTVLSDVDFRRSLIGLVSDPIIKGWWSSYFDRLDRRLQVEVINPVQTKISRFAGSKVARSIVGQPRSTIDPSGWLRSGAIVVVNTAKGTVGEDTAALIGGTLINLVGLLIGEQAGLPEDQRRPATLIVDEFHTMPGADYEAILSELAKYGASLILATQSLARLEALDREQGRSLRATVFANLDGLFAFHTSAEDARYLVRELGGEIDEHDLLELGEHQCYAKLSAGGERLPSFSVSLDPPPAGDAAIREALIESSAARYGREASAVEGDLLSALARIEAGRAASFGGSGASREGSVGPPGQSAKDAGPTTERQRPRNDHRLPKRKAGDSSSASVPDSTRQPTPADGTMLVQGELDMDSRADELEEAVS
ncbi:MAG: TraM recognition domain-containing protein [Chloroflexi bacterium]|nr:TraM recognition domain-containing protein [Chloroflexota bacterium]